MLEDGRRVIVQRGLFKALGIQQGGGREKYAEFGGAARLMQFLNSSKINELIINDFGALLKTPILFTVNKTEHYGYEATLLQDIVRAISKAYLRGTLPARQNEVGRHAELLDDALGKVGIVALVDEATGFQRDRDKDALKSFLERFLQDEQAKWVKTFSDEFFEMIFKMKGWTWHYAGTKKPQVVGHYVNDFVYSRLGPQVLIELKERNLDKETGKKKGKHFQFLSADYGHPKLREHLAALTAFGRASGYNWNSFKRMVERAFPKFGETYQIPFPDED